LHQYFEKYDHVIIHLAIFNVVNLKVNDTVINGHNLYLALILFLIKFKQ